MEERPIDRGWAWVICGAIFVIGYMQNNSHQLLAVTLLDLTQEFNTSITIVSLVFMVNMFCISFSCIITVNFLIPTFGLRRVCTPAACVYTLCGIAYAFSPNVYVFIFLATIRGIASGTLVIPAVSLMSFYFKRYSSLAASLALSGSSVASITWPSLTRYVMSVYSLRGALLLCGALEGHMILSTMLLRPLSSYRTPKIEENDDINDEATVGSPSKINSSRPGDDMYQRSRTEETPDNVMKLQDIIQREPNGARQIKVSQHQIINSDVHLNSDDAKVALLIENSKPLHPDKNSYSSPCKLDHANRHRTTMPNEYEEQTPKDAFLIGYDTTQNALDLSCEGTCYYVDDQAVVSNKLRHSAKISESPLPQRTHPLHNKVPRRFHKDSTSSTLGDTLTKATTTSKLSSAWSLASAVDNGPIAIPRLVEISQSSLDVKLSFCQRVLQIFDLSLLKQWSFVWCLFAVVPCGVNFLIFTYLPTIATFKGMSKDQGAVLLTILGSVDLGSRMTMGIVADSKILRVTTICGMCMVLLGVISLFVDVFNDMKDLIIMSVIMGLFAGVRMSLVSVMYIEVVGLDKMAKAFSLHTMTFAVVNASFNPLVGNMLETSGVNSLMYFIGGCLILAGVMLCATPLIARLQENCQKKPNESEIKDESSR